MIPMSKIVTTAQEGYQPTQDEEELVPRKGWTSVVWTWFRFRKSDANRKRYLYKLCCTTVIAGGGNTSNLFHHLKMKHAKEYYQCQKMRGTSIGRNTKAKAPQSQKSLEEAFARGTVYDKT